MIKTVFNRQNITGAAAAARCLDQSAADFRLVNSEWRGGEYAQL